MFVTPLTYSQIIWMVEESSDEIGFIIRNSSTVPYIESIALERAPEAGQMSQPRAAAWSLQILSTFSSFAFFSSSVSSLGFSSVSVASVVSVVSGGTA